MLDKKRISHWLVGAVILAAAEFAGVAAIDVALIDTAQAQFFGDDRYSGRQRPQRSGGFFDSLFGPSNRRVFDGEPEQPQAPVDNSRAPSPRKADAKAEPATTSIVVLGDGMADWLAYGLEDAFSDTPEIGILRKNKQHSGLLRYEAKGDLDWWHVARDILGPEKANYVVMMLGVGDRQNIREKDLAKEADQNKDQDRQDKPDADKTAAQNKDGAADKDPTDDPDQPSIAAPERKPGKKGIIEFRTEQWAQVYSRRIDATIAALKSKGVPVFWVGLPAIRGTRSTADVVYLNDLFRARAEKAGAVYIDVWDGFVDEAGKYSNFGPDYEGQMRRLRSSDGVYFTKYGARKLAHYVERELRRYMSNRALQVALPSGPAGPLPADGKSAARPLAGPVVPLTVPANSEELLGGSGTGSAHGDAIATRVLVKGEPVAAPAGRADDFAWPRGSQANAAQPVLAVPAAAAAASASAPAASAYTEPEPTVAEKKAAEPKSGAAAKTTQNVPARTKLQRPPPPPSNASRPPPPRQPLRRANDPFGWLR